MPSMESNLWSEQELAMKEGTFNDSLIKLRVVVESP